MHTRTIAITLLASAAAGAAGWGLYLAGLQHGQAMAGSAPAAADAAQVAPAEGGKLPQGIAEGEAATRRHIQAGIQAGDLDPVAGARVLYYHDPMVPGNRFDRPAKSPFMDMMLVPVYADAALPDANEGSQVRVSPGLQQNLGLRSVEVVVGSLAPQVSAVGSIAFNERDQVVLQARASGFVDKLYLRATLDAVQPGQALAELYLPDWIAAQEEFLSLRRMQGTALAPLIDGARQRMRQIGMDEAQIQAVEASGRTQPRTTLTAPIAGVVVELALREGMSVSAGATLLRINGLSSVWANAEVPESQAALVRPGAKVQASSPALPGATYHGTVQALLPEVNPVTRTLKARLELANPGARLVPGMAVQMLIAGPRTERALLVPSQALIRTGQRTVVLLAEDKGRFRPVNVETGIDSGDLTEIRSGLKAGQRVVVSSQFLIDSEASLKGVEARLNAAAEAPMSPPAAGSKP